MSVSRVVLLLVALCCGGGSCTLPTATCTHTIHLNSTTGNRNSLSETLGRVSSIRQSVCIELSDGRFYLDSLVNTTLVDVQDVTIAGAMNTVIECSKRSPVGITVLNSTRIYFANVTFKSCGRLHNSTSRNFNASNFSHLEIFSALYFMFCSNITMKNVTLNLSTGSGLVLYNNGGVNTFTYCVFTTCLDQGNGGSGVTIDNSYCVPGSADCTGGISIAHSTHSFKNCTFSYNKANADLRQNVVYPHGRDHMVLGKGGGASVSLRGRSIGNLITFEWCNFFSNEANVGGGLYVSFGDVSINNTLTIVDSTFESNMLQCSDKKSQWANSGEGVKIEFIYYPPDPILWPGYEPQVEGNAVKFLRSKLSNNIGCYGAAVSLVTSRNSSGVNTNSLVFDKCRFELNMAQLSSAVDLSLHHPNPVEHSGKSIQPIFSDCTFECNHITFGFITNYPLGMGALYSARVPFTLAGHNRFINNDGTALVILSAHAVAEENSFTEFIGNKGRLGGAMSFIGNSWLVSHPGSRFSFINNSVPTGGLGGAIYSAHFGEHDINQNCLFQYYKPTIPPRDWNTSFLFSGNTAHGSLNSIYTTSLLSCHWPSNHSTTGKRIYDDVFCEGHPWNFTGSDCRGEIATASSSLRVPPSHRLHAIPGWPTSLSVTAVDDYNNNVSTVLVAFPDDHYVDTVGVKKSTQYISNDKILLYGKENKRSIVKLRTLDPRVIVSQLSVEMLSCPPGFVNVSCKENEDMVCNCVCPRPLGDMFDICDRDDQNATISSHYCLTYQYESQNKSAPNKSLPLVIGQCPFNNHALKLPRTADDLNEFVCGPLKRTGLLCSQCIKDHCVAINGHFECVKCNLAYGWLLFLLVKILPVTVLFFLVALFNFKATSPAMNAFIFFGQIVSVSHYHNPFPLYFGVLTFENRTVYKALMALVQITYGALNLDFFEGVFPPFSVGSISTVTALILKYVVAVYPLLLILICYVCIKLNDRDVKVVRVLFRPFNWCIAKIRKRTKATTSIIDAIATFLLFSYTTFVYVSFPLLNTSKLYNARTPNLTLNLDQLHFYYDATLNLSTPLSILIYATIIFIIGLFVVIPLLFFLLYPVKLIQRCISRLPKNIAIKTFAESFTECYRNGTEEEGKGWDFRYFAGLYFLFRIVFLVVMVIHVDWLLQYFIQQVLLTSIVLLFAIARPYKIEWYNHLDMAMFALLSLLNACSWYNSQSLVNGGEISTPLFIFNYVLVFVPLFYVIALAGWYCFISLHCCQRKNKKDVPENIVVIAEPHSNHGDGKEETYIYEDSDSLGSDMFPDRVLNPQNYNQREHRHKRGIPKVMVTKPTNERESQEKQRQGNTENSYFLERGHGHGYEAVQRSQTEPQEFRKFV